MDTSSGILVGRPYGGVAILWKKTLSNYVHITKYDDPRIIGCNVTVNAHVNMFLNVYLPYQRDDNHDDYMNYLGKISSIISQCESSYIRIVGDFNATVGSPFEQELFSFVNANNMHISDYELLGRESGTHTYVSDAHSTTSWLDHYVCSTSMRANICDLEVLDKLPSSDHLPITAVVSFPGGVPVQNPGKSPVSDTRTQTKTCQWYKAAPVDISRYAHLTMMRLNDIHIPVAALTCTDARCQNVSHVSDMDTMYSDVSSAVLIQCYVHPD